MNTIRLLADSCPECGKRLDAATGLTSDRPPKPGDISVCVGCHAVLEFDDYLRLRLVPVEDDRRSDPEVMSARIALQEAEERRRQRGEP